MKHQCSECQRLNPPEAAYCFYDGKPLSNGAGRGEASIDFATWAFPQPFFFPSGEKCHNFLQLALACHRHPDETIEVLRQGFFETFFGSMGRVDLAMAAKAAARTSDRDRALDDFMGKLPGSPLGPAQLVVEPQEKDLGVVGIGEDRSFTLTLTNQGQRLLYGKASIEDCPWLVLGDSPEKVFQAFDKVSIPVNVVGKRLRAYTQPQKAEISIESNGGNFIVAVEVTVPVKPFTEGVLAGAASPRQLAEKAKVHPREAGILLEEGAVARWYEANGWPYPVQGPVASGVAAVQQFFEVLGLVKPPKVEVGEQSVTLTGGPGDRLEHTLPVTAQEKRAVVAHAVSDQPWLTVGKTLFQGRMASIPLIVSPVPSQPGETLTAHLKVTANGNQRFDVPVTLQVTGTRASSEATAASSAPTALPAATAVEDLASVPAALSMSGNVPVLAPAVAPAVEAPAVEPPPTAVPVTDFSDFAPPSAPVPRAARAPAAGRKTLSLRLLPVAIVALGLLTAVVRDALFREQDAGPLPEPDYAHPVLAPLFHDQVLPNDYDPFADMRFGLGIPDPKDPARFKTRLVYDEPGQPCLGRTCNVIVRVDKTIEYMLGVEQGSWKAPMRDPLGKDRAGNTLTGARSVWVRSGPPPITVTQWVEIVPGGLSPDGSKRLLDTCLVRYDLTNEDTVPHTVALRFLLDTFIGTNDAVPFTIAGAKELCDTMKTFDKPEDVPDYISAMERPDLKDPGTVAHLVLRYGGGLEPPGKVTLGAWPASSLRLPPTNDSRALQQNTRWEVPVHPMALARSAENPKGDSAVTMYWMDREVAPKATRSVGFAYGLGSVSGEKGGQLGITAGGQLVAGKEFTLTAYVKNPPPGTKATLTLPKGLELGGDSKKEQDVPPVPPGASSPFSPVTWRVKAVKDGVKRVKVSLSTGVTDDYKLVIKPGLFE